MPLRTGHGTGKGTPRIELIADELPDPVPALPRSDAGDDHGQGGRFVTGNKASAEGGRAKAGKISLARTLGLDGMAENPAFAPYERAARSFRRRHCRELAAIAGGRCGTGPSAMVASAALQLAASRFLFATGAAMGDAATLKTASTIADSSRQNLLGAYELAVREAKARPADPAAAHRRLAAALAEEDPTE